MAGKENDDRKSKEAKIDYAVFEDQIDLEIDRLFVPHTGVMEETDQPSMMEVKIDELQEPLEIETLILDSEGISSIDGPSSDAADTRAPTVPPPADGIGLDSPGTMTTPGLQRSDEMTSHFEPPGPVSTPHVEFPLSMESQEPAVRGPVSDQFQPPKDQPPDYAKLQPLLESLDATLLSLDWDFSPETIVSLDQAVSKLEPFCRRNQETVSLLKVLRAVLQRLKKETRSIPPPLMDFVSDALDLLKKLLRTPAAPQPQEKAQLKQLLAKLQAIRAKTAGPETSGLAVEPDAAAGPWETGPGEPLATVTPEQVLGASAGQSLKDLREWMELQAIRFKESLEKLDEETKRLLQLEEVLSKKAALAPVTARVNKVRSSLQGFLHTWKQTEQEWAHRVHWLRTVEGCAEGLPPALPVSPAAVPPLEPVPPTSTPPRAERESVALEVPPGMASHALADTLAEFVLPGGAGETETPEPEVEHTPLGVSAPPTTPQTKEEELALFDVLGNTYAVPDSCVVKIHRISGKSAARIMGRGYASLADFKPFLGSLKTGVLGSWKNQPVKDLKAYRFFLVRPELFCSEPIPSPEMSSAGGAESMSIAGVLLVSDGQRHGMIFTESSKVNHSKETVELVFQGDVQAGIVQREASRVVHVLNVEGLLRKTSQDSV